MNTLEKRKLKTNLYKHGNTIMYIAIFAMASIITIAAAMNRGNGIEYIDESKIASVKETVAVTNKNTQKVATNETNMETSTEEATTQPDTTVVQTTEQEDTHDSLSKIRITADTLNVRAEASQDAQILGMADEGDVFDVIADDGEWIEINFNGNNGFIKAEFAESVE